MPCSPPGHGLCREKLQLIVVQTETGKCEQTSECFSVQVVERVVTQTKPFDVLQALEGEEVTCLNKCSSKRRHFFRLEFWFVILRNFVSVVVCLPGRPCWGYRPAGCV